jgi:hypothetical protein
MKRYIYIIIGIVVVAIIAILVLLFIKNQKTGANSTTAGTTTTTGSLPSVGTQGSNPAGTNGGGGDAGTTTGTGPSTTGTSGSTGSGQTATQNFNALSSDPVLDYFIASQNNITAIEPTGAIVSISNGQSTTINSSTINDIISASFSYDGKKIIVSFGSPTNPQSSIFNLTTQTWAALPQGMRSPQWSQTNYQIAYLSATSGGKLALSTIDAANLKKAPVTLLTLNASDLVLQWPSKNQIVLSDKPTAYNAGSVWVFNTQAGTLTPLVYETPGVESLWSNNTTTPYGLVFSISPSGQSDVLQLQALSGSAPTQTLNFTTLPSKCAFGTEQVQAPATTGATTTSVVASSDLALYCGIPRSSSGFSSARLPDDYNDMALFTADDIYKINTATGATQALWNDRTQNMDVSDVKLFGYALFFVNRYDQKLYSLTLPQ